MAEGVLLGAAMGGGTAALTGQDPLKGAALGGAMGGIGGAMSSAPTAAGAGATTGAATAAANGSMVPLATQQAASGAALGGVNSAATAAANGSMTPLSSQIGGGFQNITGLTNRDMTKMALDQGVNAMQPEPEQQIQAAPMGQGISRPQVDLSQGIPTMSSNPRLRKQGLL